MGDAALAAAATLPLGILAWLVFRTSVGLTGAAWVTLAATAVVAVAVFRLPPAALTVAMAKGAWTGVWILLIVVPALLLYEVVLAAGAFDRLSAALDPVVPTRARRVLLLAWVFPSFLQGVAGFGVPVVVAAPMLVRAGLAPTAAVAACLIGYHWSVTFGSMGSSFFVAAGTAGLDAAATASFALRAALLLAGNALVAAALLLRRVPGGFADAGWRALALWVVMALVLVGTAVTQPALGSTAAGLAGLLVAVVVLRERGVRPEWARLLLAAAPYLLLTGLVALVFGVPWLRALAEQVPAAGPTFPATSTGRGHLNVALAAHQPFRPLLHPAVYVLVSAAAAAALYRRVGWLHAGRGVVLPAWMARSRATIVSIVGLTVLAAVMVDAGMMATLAAVLTRGLGGAYLLVAPLVGLAGTVMTGSTTASNALLAPLQADAAAALGVAPSTLLAAQTAGGNVGNALAPVNVLVAAVAVGIAGQEASVIRATARDSWPLVVVVVLATLALARW